MTAPTAFQSDDERDPVERRRGRRGGLLAVACAVDVTQCDTTRPSTRIGGKPGTTLAQRFWPKVDKRGSDECWPWLGLKDKAGYGRVYGHAGKVLRAHRAAYAIGVGPIPLGKIICHRCDNPPCVNPAHLFIGSHGDNHRDMVSKGRKRGPVGERNSFAKLTRAQVAVIRGSSLNDQQIATQYGISHRHVYAIRRGYFWK